jgi:hypothetical protein
MPSAARLYVAIPCIGDFEQCERVGRELAGVVRERNRPGVVINYYARTLTREAGIAEENLNPERVQAATGGRFPFLWVNLTYDPDRVGEAELVEIETRFGLRQFDAVGRGPIDLFNLDLR